MEIIKYPAREEWEALQQRPVLDTAALFDVVRRVLDDVRTDGDAAVKRYGEKFDHVSLEQLAVTPEEMREAESLLPDDLKQAIRTAHDNIAAFHAAQRFEGVTVETMPGVTCRQKAVPIEKVGLYVPGGTAPLFSTVLMLAVPARIAGCGEIVLCTPPNREGKVQPAILFSARLAGVDRIFKAGGIQAIAAMTYGTESIPRVYKIFGPGNQYVMAAKQWVGMRDVATDMPAGPSEVAIIADETACPAFIASDFLSQAEHGADSQSLLLTTSEPLANAVVMEIERQLALLSRRALTEQSLGNSRIIILRDTDEMIAFSNGYAPEHLIIQTADLGYARERILNAGSVFLGAYTPESAGDYASGTNHTLPTNGYARAYSGVNLDSFVKKITFQEITKEGLRALGATICAMANGERLDAHANAVAVRLKDMEF
ncbi:MAG: histidinol dehydrogenase [Tannerella sp.]|jgi:histidinol dehydrogenase|nr:histidinol dehydrogenase [Tannerella sp.]